MIAHIAEFITLRSTFVDKVRDYIRNTEICLDNRWATFLAAETILPVEIYGDGFIATLDDRATMYDDFYRERRQTINYSDMDERIQEYISEYSEYPEDNERYAYFGDNYDLWREEILKSGYGAFIYNW